MVNGQISIPEELERYALIRRYYTKNKGRENFNGIYLHKILNRLTEIAFFDDGMPIELKQKSENIIASFHKISNYI